MELLKGGRFGIFSRIAGDAEVYFDDGISTSHIDTIPLVKLGDGCAGVGVAPNRNGWIITVTASEKKVYKVGTIADSVWLLDGGTQHSFEQLGACGEVYKAGAMRECIAGVWMAEIENRNSLVVVDGVHLLTKTVRYHNMINRLQFDHELGKVKPKKIGLVSLGLAKISL